MTQSSQTTGDNTNEVADWADIGGRMWEFLTGREAAIHYSFDNMAVEVPRDTGANALRATWKINGTLTVTTSDRRLPADDGA